MRYLASLGLHRFWYGGTGGNSNRFASEAQCESVCVAPPGSASCYLPPVPGVCTGRLQRWAYQPQYSQCTPFQYGGCLGNNNRYMDQVYCDVVDTGPWHVMCRPSARPAV